MEGITKQDELRRIAERLREALEEVEKYSLDYSEELLWIVENLEAMAENDF